MCILCDLKLVAIASCSQCYAVLLSPRVHTSELFLNHVVAAYQGLDTGEGMIYSYSLAVLSELSPHCQSFCLSVRMT